MTYYYIGQGTSGGVSDPVDYTELIQSIRDKGGTVSDDATFNDIITAVNGIPLGVEPTGLLVIENAITERGGTITKEGDVATVEELAAAIWTIPDSGGAGSERKYPVSADIPDDQYADIEVFLEERTPEYSHFWELTYKDRQDKEVYHYVVTKTDVGGFVVTESWGSTVIAFANGVSDYYFSHMIIDGVPQEPDDMEGLFADTFNYSIKENAELQFKYLEVVKS